MTETGLRGRIGERKIGRWLQVNWTSDEEGRRGLSMRAGRVSAAVVWHLWTDKASLDRQDSTAVRSHGADFR